ncbi:MAG: AraC family transcriptional regulator [Desulfobacteraceae bacterium]|nr:MAG: AraC family transcriptional regulator [Desulfobacteraceae bacterium]
MQALQIDHKENIESTSAKQAYLEYTPCAELKPYINCFWSYHCGSAVQDPIKHIILPDGCIDIIFDYGADRPDPAFIVGAMTKPIMNQRQHLLGIRFQPGMAYSFLKTPLHHLTDLTVDLSAVWGPSSQEIHSKMLETNPAGAWSVLTRELIGRLDQAAVPDQRILAAVSWIKKHNGSLSVQQLSDKLGLSRQHFKRRCAQYTGLTPKNLLTTYRFKALMKQAKSNPTLAWSRLAVDAGYYDQAHLISEFKTMTGLTPTRYFQDIRRYDQVLIF